MVQDGTGTAYPLSGPFVCRCLPSRAMPRFHHPLIGRVEGCAVRVRRLGLSVAPCFLWECLTSPAVSPSPTPATSNGAGGFPALRFPARFAPKAYVTYPVGSAFGGRHTR